MKATVIICLQSCQIIDGRLVKLICMSSDCGKKPMQAQGDHTKLKHRKALVSCKVQTQNSFAARQQGHVRKTACSITFSSVCMLIVSSGVPQVLTTAVVLFMAYVYDRPITYQTGFSTSNIQTVKELREE